MVVLECVPVPRQAHTRTRAYVCNLMRSPGEEILRKAGCRRERTIKRLQVEAKIIAHAWLTPANFSFVCPSGGGHAPRLRSRPERASDMHAQAPNTQTFLPAFLLPTACDYNGLDCFDPLVPPSAPELTLQASGQGQASARPKGGPPCCSVPVPCTRWAASGASPPLKTSCVCLYQEKLTLAHVGTCAAQ